LGGGICKLHAALRDIPLGCRLLEIQHLRQFLSLRLYRVNFGRGSHLNCVRRQRPLFLERGPAGLVVHHIRRDGGPGDSRPEIFLLRSHFEKTWRLFLIDLGPRRHGGSILLRCREVHLLQSGWQIKIKLCIPVVQGALVLRLRYLVHQLWIAHALEYLEWSRVVNQRMLMRSIYNVLIVRLRVLLWVALRGYLNYTVRRQLKTIVRVEIVDLVGSRGEALRHLVVVGVHHHHGWRHAALRFLIYWAWTWLLWLLG
jgi:hypothetical protein